MEEVEERATARVLVSGEEPLQREGLCALLRERGPWEVIPVDQLEHARRLHDPGRPWAVAALVERAPSEFVEAFLTLRRNHPELALVLVADRLDDALLEPLVANPQGRIAVLDRRSRPRASDVVAALAQVLRGRSSLDGRFVRQLIRPQPTGRRTRLERLTEVERDVVLLLADGLRNSEIGRRLARSEKSVEKHVSSVFEKFGLCPHRMPHVDRRVAAARLVLEEQAGLEGA